MKIILMCIFFPLLCHAGWEFSLASLPDDASHEWAVVSRYAEADRGTPTLDDTLKRLAGTGKISKLKHLYVPGLVADLAFQKEVFDSLVKLAPAEFGAAKASAGNMHNPKMIALHRAFERAVLATPTVTAAVKSLAPYGLTVSGAAHEKLTLIHQKDGDRIMCILWLLIGPVAVAPTSQ